VKGIKWLAALLGIGAVASAHAADPSVNAPEHAVIVRFQYGSTDLSDLFALEEKLEAAIVAADAGEYDGNEVAVGGGDATLYMYGPNGDRLFETVKPVLESSDFMRGAEVRIRYGAPKDGTREKVVRIAP
jgi:hypothetical protein